MSGEASAMRRSLRRLAARCVRALAAVLLLVAEGCAFQTARAAADELLVGFASGTTSAQAEAVYAPLGAAKVEEMPTIGVHRIRVAPGAIDSVERVLRGHPRVLFVERNKPVHP